ncbi:MAG: hypothetical protein AB1679_01300 [Actinomycetota bacterium]|jgi:hypothetical protein
MTDLHVFPRVRSEAVSLERRSGGDRRRGDDRRTADLWRETGRPGGLDLRSGVDRRWGGERRRGFRPSKSALAEIVTPWQIPEPRREGQEGNRPAVPAGMTTMARVADLLGR